MAAGKGVTIFYIGALFKQKSTISLYFDFLFFLPYNIINFVTYIEENLMKSKPMIISFLCCFLAALFVFGFSGALMAQEKAAAKSRTTAQASEPVKRDATYWFNKGALVSTYGNNRAAIQYFQKAIALDPNFSGAYFSQGVSYGQLGQYQKAIAQISRAIKMEPQKGMYYYGRGRVYLLAGDKTKAMADIKKAADLQDEDALNYLDYINRDKK